MKGQMKDHDLQRSRTNIFFSVILKWYFLITWSILWNPKTIYIFVNDVYLQEKIQTVLTMWTKLLMCPRMLRLCCKSYWIMRLIHDDGLLVWIQWVILRLKECVWTGQPGLTLPSTSWYLSWHEVWLWSHNSE